MNALEGGTMIGKSVKITGDLSGSEDLTMDGELHGTIRLAGSRLTIGPSARVRGDITAKDVVIFGRVDGDIRAVGRVELRASSGVQGNIYAGSLSIEDNAAFRGQVDPSRSQEATPVGSRVAVPGSGAAGENSRPLPAALAAVAASRSAAADSPDAKNAGERSSLFAETEA